MDYRTLEQELVLRSVYILLGKVGGGLDVLRKAHIIKGSLGAGIFKLVVSVKFSKRVLCFPR